MEERTDGRRLTQYPPSTITLWWGTKTRALIYESILSDYMSKTFKHDHGGGECNLNVKTVTSGIGLFVYFDF